MEQHNIEKLIKEAIKDRSIEPSKQARERLITALNSEPKKKKHRWIYYASAAAVLILLYVVGSQVQNENLDSEKLPEIIVQKEELDSNTNKEKQKDNAIQPENLNDKITSNSDDKSLNKNQINRGSIAEGKTIKNTMATRISESLAENNLLVSKLNTTENDVENTVEKASNDLDTSSKTLQKSFSFITPEHLLAEVETDSSPKTIPFKTPKTKNYVESNQLLLEMERQLFDEKNKSIFKKAGHQLKKVKTAVANRNFKD
jgi:hypothetical protein